MFRRTRLVADAGGQMPEAGQFIELVLEAAFGIGHQAVPGRVCSLCFSLCKEGMGAHKRHRKRLDKGLCPIQARLCETR